MNKSNIEDTKFLLCINNDDYKASLELGKFYISIVDKEAAEDGLVRIIDESGEDYLYPSEMFTNLKMPKKIKQKISSRR